MSISIHIPFYNPIPDKKEGRQEETEAGAQDVPLPEVGVDPADGKETPLGKAGEELCPRSWYVRGPDQG